MSAWLFGLCLGMGLGLWETRGANLGFDNASNPNYSPASNTTPLHSWINTGNVSGNAFGGWYYEANGNWAIGTGSQNSLGGANTALDTGGKSFVMRAWNTTSVSGSGTNTVNGFAKATRYIDPAGLDAGQSFSFSMAVNFRNGFKGVDLFDDNDNKIFNFNIGGDDYSVFSPGSSGTPFSIGNTYSPNTFFNLNFNQTSAAGGTWVIERLGGSPDSDTGSYSGVLRKLSLYIGETGFDAGENDLVFNNLTVIPEPTAFSLLAVALGTALQLRRKNS